MHLVTLGSLELRGSTLTRPVPLLLLAYLAWQGPQARTHLQELLWPGTARPAASLRVALAHVRRAAPGALVEDGVRVGCAATSDAAALREAWAAGDDARCLALYTGPFLQALPPRARVAGELEEWLYETREHLADLARLAALRLAERAAPAHPARAARLAERAARTEGATPPTAEVRARLRRLLPDGHPLASEGRGDHEDGGEPPERPAFPAPDAPDTPLPAAPVLGREAETALVAHLLSDAGGRAVVIAGAFGSGKTALATAALRERADLHGDAVAVVDARDVRDEAGAFARVARALHSTAAHWDALADEWGDAPLTLLVDAAEGWPGWGAPLAALRRRCPALRIVLTGRAARPWADAALVTLGGLVGHGHVPDGDAARSSASVRLFARHAPRAVRLDDDGEARDAARVARALAGSPLALVEAAAALDVLPLAKLARALEDGEFATVLPRLAGDPAVFARTRAALTPEEHAALVHLAPFEDFDGDTAANVARVPTATLVALVRHGEVLHRDGRYRVAPLTRPFLDGPALDAARAAFARHFLGALTRGGWGEAFTAEWNNVRRALDGARASGAWTREAIDAFTAFADWSGRHAQGRALFARWREQGDPTEEVRAPLAIGQAWLALRQGRSDEAGDLAGEVLGEGGGARPTERMKAHNIRAVVRAQAGEYAAAARDAFRAARQARAFGDEARAMMYTNNLALFSLGAGLLDEAEAGLREACAWYRARRRAADEAGALLNLGAVLVVRGHPEDLVEAAHVLDRGARYCERHGAARLAALYRVNAALLAVRRGDDAREGARAAVEAARALDDPAVLASALVALARASLARHDAPGAADEARVALREALGLAWDTQEVPQLLETLGVTARSLAARGERALAAALARAAAHDARTAQHHRREAQGLLKDLGAAPDAAPDAPIERLHALALAALGASLEVAPEEAR